ncbi:MAG: DUF4317 domain-containing protein [Lachnospiraceae bacterium]|nr:DUF4317 domain-containing protein [Lachnospiraceae bacterium]
MNKKEVTEIKRRFKKEGCSITRVCGCYVDAGKEKITQFGQTFLNLEDEEFHKYLEIVNKCLSGTVGNNLMELQFPLDEELDDGTHKILMALRESKLKDDGLLDAFYDHVIETYDFVGNYLILLFHDVYDVPTKTTDDLALDESEVVYEYIMCALCPVNLSKPGLGYREDENRIGARIRDWVVGPVDTGFTFPAFTDRCADIHSIMLYAKDPKEPHKEFWERGMGCDSKYTAAEKKQAFENMVIQAVGADNEEAKEVLIDVHQNLNDYIVEQAEFQDKDQPVILDKDHVNLILEESGLSEQKAKTVSEKFEEFFPEEKPDAAEILDARVIKNNEVRVEKKHLEEQVASLTKQLEESGVIQKDGESVDIVVKVAPEKVDQITSTFVDGVKCLVIPLEETDSATVNGENFN